MWTLCEFQNESRTGCVLTCSPGLVEIALLLELLGQVVQSFQTADLSQEPLLVTFLNLLQAFPCIGDVL